MLDKQLGEAIKAIRKANNDTVITLGNKLNLSKSYISALESGKKRIPLNFIFEFANVYSLDPDVIERLVELHNVCDGTFVNFITQMTDEELDAAYEEFKKAFKIPYYHDDIFI